ncbi:MAG: rRNA maturation RNase YbeY [Bacteroidetes bacterium]|nr:MAG: rRNA maturation RNase YbeY [Bacteroidota bacterium]
MSQSIHFHQEDISFQLQNIKALRLWIIESVFKENKRVGQLSFIFCSDNYLLKINKNYLNHDFFTDVISFDYTEENRISGDIYISLDRVKENAKEFSSLLKDELHRIIIHGLLHLIGYSDKTPDQKAIMKDKEDFYLSLRAF